MRGALLLLGVLAALSITACGESGTGTVTKTRTVVVDTSARIADFKEEGDGSRSDMIAWFETELCGNRSAFACRCYSDRINWQAGSADDFEDLVIDLINGERRAVALADDVTDRCEVLTSDRIMAALDGEVRDSARRVIAQTKRTTALVLGERARRPADEMSCDEWSRVPRSVRRVLARSIFDGTAWEALHARHGPAEITAAIDLGCEAHPDGDATGWLAAEMVLGSGGESALP